MTLDLVGIGLKVIKKPFCRLLGKESDQRSALSPRKSHFTISHFGEICANSRQVPLSVRAV